MLHETLLGLRLVGPANPIAPSALDAAEERDGLRFPRAYRALLETWGVGQLCGFTYMLDPTNDHPDYGWQWFRKYVRTDGMMSRRTYNQWRGVSDATWLRLVRWADLDGKFLAWDTGKADAKGEYPIWFFDREGECAVLAARSMETLVRRFLLGGGVDRALPPVPGGCWDMPPTYVTQRHEDVEARLLGALSAGDEESAEALLALHRESVNGYEASAQLLALLMRREADDLPAALRLAWFERAAAWASRCGPELIKQEGVPEVLAALRAGRSIDDVIAFETTVDPACEPLTLACSVARWRASSVVLEVRNPGPTASAPCAQHIEAERDGAAPDVCRFEVEAIEPGGERVTSFIIPSPMPRRVRVALRPT